MHESVVAAARDELLKTLGEYLGGVDRWAAVDYPMHTNCGDGAIYAGQLALAGQLGISTSVVLDRNSYRRSALPRDGAVVIQGGGNWGGLYETHHALRLQVLEDTVGRPTFQMPQSVEYSDASHREALRRAVGRHGAFTLFVRDQRSYARAVADYDCPVVLVPDLAFALGELPRPRPAIPLVVQARTDQEAPEGQLVGGAVDWLVTPPASPTARAMRTARRWNRVQARVALGRFPARRAMAALATSNVERGCAVLGQGEAVVTDRLHGHVLCTLMRVPHVVIGDRYGKVKALRQAWTAKDPISRFADTWADVPDRLGELGFGTGALRVPKVT